MEVAKKRTTKRGRRTKDEHYYTENPTSKEKSITIREQFRGKTYTFETSSGIFSPRG